MSESLAYPGIYMVCDPQPGRARASVAAMLRAFVSHEHTLAIEGDGFALAAVPVPGSEPSCGPGLHCDSRGVLLWTGEMFLPQAWIGASGPVSPQRVAAIVRQRLLTQGPQALADIDGSFCGAWYDSEKRAWTVFNDRWGLIPLFWWADRERFVVSPRAKVTWQASGTPLQLDDNGAADLLRTQNMLDDHTLIAGVHWLEPARCLTYTGRQVQQRRYWDFQHAPTTPASYDDLIDRFLDASHATIDRMTATGAPLVQGISGGLDSRMFLAVCHDLHRVPACYTSGFAYGEDMRFGRQLARLAGASHESLLLEAEHLPAQLQAAIIETDGLHGAAHLATSAPIGPHLGRHHRGSILIEGYLHGVLGGSDLPADADMPVDLPAHQHSWARDFLHGGGDPQSISELLRDDLAADSLARWQTHVDDSFGDASVDDPLCRAEYTIITGRSGRNDVLVPAGFRRHVLARHPACDRRMVEWYATTPANLRRARKVYIDVLRRRFPQFASVPRADSSSGMPLTDSRLLREYCWQREKLYSCWSKLRHADVRRYGRDSLSVRAWTFEACRNAGLFAPLLEGEARVLRWVQPAALIACWKTACDNPRQAIPMLSLLTLETMVRELERCDTQEASRGLGIEVAGVDFRSLRVGTVRAQELAEV